MDKKITVLSQLLEIKRFSPKSIKTYVNAFRQFLKHFTDLLSEKDIENFINWKLELTETALKQIEL